MSFIESMKYPKGLTVSPTGSGKSLSIYLQVQYLKFKNPNTKILCLFPTTTLIEQMYDDFEDYSNIDQKNNIQKIYSFKGSTKNVEKGIIFSTWQSIYKQSKDYFEQFDAVIVDEVHGADAKYIKSIINSSVNAVYKRGYTGTLKDTQIHLMTLTGLFGKIYEAITYDELREQGRISKSKINIHHLCYNVTERKDVCKMNYQEEMIHLGTHEGRAKYLAKEAFTQKGNKLLLFQRIENHGHILLEEFKAYAKTHGFDENQVFYVDGKTKTKDRNDIRKLVEDNDDVILLASYQTFSTGINIKNLQHVYLASPYKSKIKVLQSIGRGLRKDGKDNYVNLHDIVDDFSVSMSKMNYSMKQFTSRLQIYCANGFDLNHFKKEIK